MKYATASTAAIRLHCDIAMLLLFGNMDMSLPVMSNLCTILNFLFKCYQLCTFHFDILSQIPERSHRRVFLGRFSVHNNCSIAAGIPWHHNQPTNVATPTAGLRFASSVATISITRCVECCTDGVARPRFEIFKYVHLQSNCCSYSHCSMRRIVGEIL